jgi:hypothetical protein
MAALLRRSPLGASFLEVCIIVRDPWLVFGGAVSVSSTSTTSSLGGMVQWGLDDGRAMMDLCRAVASSDAVAALMAGW